MTEKPLEETPDDKKAEVEEVTKEVAKEVIKEVSKEVTNTERIEGEEVANTERIEEFDSSTESESLLKKSMKAAKNKRFDPMMGTPTERTTRFSLLLDP